MTWPHAGVSREPERQLQNGGQSKALTVNMVASCGMLGNGSSQESSWKSKAQTTPELESPTGTFSKSCPAFQESWVELQGSLCHSLPPHPLSQESHLGHSESRRGGSDPHLHWRNVKESVAIFIPPPHSYILTEEKVLRHGWDFYVLHESVWCIQN